MVKKAKDLQYYEAVGRRKESVARVRLYITDKNKGATLNGKKILPGQIVVNGQPLEAIFPREVEIKKCLFPLELANAVDRFAISIISRGGGRNGQLEAIILGISRALCVADINTFKPLLKEHGLMTRDPRIRERRKVGMGGKARRKKQSPKR